jgi:carbamoyl-phosphate synthase large subunit
MECEAVVAAVPDFGRFSRRFCFTANSRHITKVRRLRGVRPPPAWASFGREPGQGPADFADAILRLCEEERIDLVFPSCDDVVAALAARLPDFQARGIQVPVNGAGVLRGLMDKLLLNRLAQDCGIPCPRTLSAAAALADPDLFRDGAPRVVKPRLGSTAHGVGLVRGREELSRWVEGGGGVERWLVQEFVPGERLLYGRFYLAGDGTLVHSSCVACERPGTLIHQSQGLALAPAPWPDCRDALVAMLRRAGYVGYGHAQFKVDARDGTPRLMELSVRIGRGTWTEGRVGVDAPRLHLCLFEGLSGGGASVPAQVPAPRRFLWPVQDAVILLASAARRVLGGAGRVPPLRRLLRHGLDLYFGAADWEASNFERRFWDDPWVGLSYWIHFAYLLAKRPRHLERWA